MTTVSDVYALYAVGLRDEAFDLTDRASFAYLFDTRKQPPRQDSITTGVIFFALNAEMMRDVRFVSFCAKLGLCDYWLSTERWPDCVEDLARYYDFKRETVRLAQTTPRPSV